MKILVLGSSGMIGSAVLRILSENEEWQVFGSARSSNIRDYFNPSISQKIIDGVHVDLFDSLIKVFTEIRPDVVVNCIGLTKHKPLSEDPLISVPVNSLLPHRLAGLCELVGARLIHISTDCVFSGSKGNYSENDATDACDVYGRSKALGEVNYPHAITLRTSTIGHELQSKYGLLDWFLSQQMQCKGYACAFFSGLPSIVFAQVIRDVVIPRHELSGLYHVSAEPINKFDLLKLISKTYDKKIDIVRDERFVIDRTLDSTKFQMATGYIAPQWPDLIKIMHAYK